MISLLIITHEKLGAAYSALAKHFFPDDAFEQVHILSVEKSDDHASIIERAQALLPKMNQGHGVLILTDIFGATPCNAALKMVQLNQSAIISGLNVPMLIKALGNRHKYTELTPFVELVQQAGISGIMAFVEPIN